MPETRGSGQSLAQRTPNGAGISRIVVAGFKSLVDETAIEVRPLTVLSGANSSGKSSLMQPLLLLKQTLESGHDPGALLLHGPNVKFTSADQLLSRLSATAPSDRLRIGLSATPRTSTFIEFLHRAKQGFELSYVEYTTAAQTQRYHLQMSQEEISQVAPRFSFPPQGAPQKVPAVTPEFRWVVVRERCFFSLIYQQTSSVGAANEAITNVYFQASPFGAEQQALLEMIHLPGLRGNPERTYPVTAIGPTFPGTFDKYVASVIAHWQNHDKPSLESLNEDLSTLGLTWKVSAQAVDDTQVELLVGRLPRPARGGAKDLVSIADVGFGVSQILPVVVALKQAKPHQLLYIEQPEIHLHPRAQTGLADLLCVAASRGVHIVLETHSEMLLLGLQSSVASGALDPRAVRLHWFGRRSDGRTEIIAADVDDAGAFGDWPQDFSEVSLSAQRKYLDAAQRRLGFDP